MSQSRDWSRRRFLQGLGASVALPLFGPFAGPLLADRAKAPQRLLFVFAPNGAHMPDWTPKTTGKDFELPWILEPLAPFKSRLAVISGLTLDSARHHGDGPGDHARAGGAFLTCARPKKTAGEDIRVGTSVDQVAAQALADRTRFASLELGLESSRQAGACDAGYSCAYSSNISWRSPNTPNTKETHPKRLFERLFEDPDRSLPEEIKKQRRIERRSVLDLVMAESKSLRGDLSPNDRRKLDEFQDSMRDVERRLDRQGQGAFSDLQLPDERPAEFQAHGRAMIDVLALAFQADLTRVATLMLGNAGSDRNYREIGVPEGHHEISHHGSESDKIDKIRRINRHQIEVLAYALEKLAAIDEGGQSLLDRVLICYGSGISDGNVHNHENLPILVAGGGPSAKLGRHLACKAETPLANLYLSLLGEAGVSAASFGDSTGALAGW